VSKEPAFHEDPVGAGSNSGIPDAALPAFTVVGVGASAGGLEAFTELLRHLAPTTGMAFVLVQHLDPTHESLLPSLLASKTAMTVIEATDDLPVVPNTVYVAPAAEDVTIERGVLKLSSRQVSGHHLPIDAFLASLARDRRTRAVAVVLSGTASDGAAGVQAVKREGGVSLAQDPSTAKYRDMPENAIATGAVDFVLPIPLLARQLSVIAGYPHSAPDPGEPQPAPALSVEDPILADLLTLVHSATKADFSHYKQSTVMRRISRRMSMRHLDDLESYLDLLRGDPAEVEALYQDLLIRVTSFFRQPEVFETLKEKFFPQIAESRTGGQTRFWVPGCASGEEAYSLAMTWVEFQGANNVERLPFQVFASDINQQVIDKARRAIYPESSMSGVSPERLERFFSRVDAGYQVVKSIREACVFARHDLTRDPPFSRLDLISLRNVLIYLGPLLQRRVMPLLHFALRPGGFLMLGESESVGGFIDLFSLVDRKGKIYTVRPGGVAFVPPSPFRPAGEGVDTPSPVPQPVDFDPSTEADRIVLGSYAPVGVIVDADLQIRRFRGRTGPYLEPGPGRVSFDLLRMARGGLAGELSGALREATKDGIAVHRKGVRILRDDHVALVDFDVIPMRSPTGEPSFLVLFQDVPWVDKEAPSERPAGLPGAAGDPPRQIAELGQELSEMRAYVRAVLEDKEAANEELRSSNEELQSTNEELQSVNEELETASEELQSANEELRSLNEELRTVNDQLAALNEELTARNTELREVNAALDLREIEVRSARDYALAVIDTVREPLVILDPDFLVVSASPPFYSIFNTSANHIVGQDFFQLDERQWDLPGLREATRRALVEGVDFQDFVVEGELARMGRRTVLLSGRRVHAGGSGAASVLLAIDDITKRAHTEALSDALDQVNLTMISTAGYDELLERVMTEATRALGCDEAVLAVPADGPWITRFSSGASWARPGAAVPDEEARLFSALAIGQRAVVSTSLLERRARFSSREAGTQVVHVPLGSRDRVVGALSFGRRGRGATFTEAELDFIEKVAPALSLALENATLHANEHRIAEVLQLSLLKPVVTVPGLEIGLAYRPAHTAERVGGDFYDLFALEDDRVAVMVGDVCGSGVQAATMTETVRATLRALASLDPSPASILTRANELLLAQTSSDQFITVLLAIMDIARGRIVISSAGHPPLVVCGRTARFLETPHGAPLAAMRTTSGYCEAEYDLLPGETVVLYTDGLIEARRGTDLFGEQRLLGAVSRQNCTDVQQMVDALVLAATEHAHGRLADDLAVIAVHVPVPSAEPQGKPL
jgi:two-component system, chemotaxis family, CheB/CheR fusion protein